MFSMGNGDEMVDLPGSVVEQKKKAVGSMDLCCDPAEYVNVLLDRNMQAKDVLVAANEYYHTGGTRQAICAHGRSFTLPCTMWRIIRSAKWQRDMRLMPEQPGQCYLHSVRRGKRYIYLAALGRSPTFEQFVRNLEPGDLDLQVAKSMKLFRLEGSIGSVVYHVASSYSDGVLLGSLYDCIASLIQLYPFVNSRCVFPVSEFVSMPLVGVIGGVPSPTRVSATSFERVMGSGSSSLLRAQRITDAVLAGHDVDEGARVLLLTPNQVGISSFSRADDVTMRQYTVVSGKCAMYCFDRSEAVSVSGCELELTAPVTILICPSDMMLVGWFSRLTGDEPNLYRRFITNADYKALQSSMTSHDYVGVVDYSPVSRPVAGGIPLDNGNHDLDLGVTYLLPQTFAGIAEVSVLAGCVLLASYIRLFPGMEYRTAPVSMVGHVAVQAQTLALVRVGVCGLSPLSPGSSVLSPLPSEVHDRQSLVAIESQLVPGLYERMCAALRSWRHPKVSVDDSGYCYLRLFPLHERDRVRMLLGPSPLCSDVAKVLTPVRKKYFVFGSNGMYHVSTSIPGSEISRAYAELLGIIAMDPGTRVGGDQAVPAFPEWYQQLATPAFAVLVSCCSMLVAVLCLLVRIYFITRPRY